MLILHEAILIFFVLLQQLVCATLILSIGEILVVP
jgi:hypothetical protein